MTATETGRPQPGRRTIVKGAAWAVPAVTIASAAPAMAASPQPGLNGWVVISRQSFWDGGWRCRVRYDGYRNGDTHYNGTRLGLWVWDAQIADVATPQITIHLPYQVTWSLDTGNSGWSLPTYLGVISGYHSYQSTYTGAYTQGTDSEGRPEVLLNGRPHFVGVLSGSCPSNQYQAITRSVVVRGVPIAFKREVNFPSSNPNLQQAPESQQSIEGDAAAVTASPDQETPAPPETSEAIQYFVG